MSKAAAGTLEALRAGGRRALAQALARLEAAPEETATLDLLDAAYAAPMAQVVGLTGPPGVGKSTLLSRLIRAYRARGLRVAAIVIDPSSRRSGGALLGDRLRLEVDPEDAAVFVRSMAARDRLGGLAPLTLAGTVLLRALYDRVLVETVGVGQSETDLALLADTVVLCVQPGSGDAVQYMKAGIAEVPDVAVVGKADLGPLALAAQSALEAALSLAGAPPDGWRAPVLMASAGEGRGVAELISCLERHWAFLGADGRLAARRRIQALAALEDALRTEFGRFGLARARELGLAKPDAERPFRHLQAAHDRMRALWRRGCASGS